MKKKSRRQLRTAMLALFAAASFVWSAIYIFDVPANTMLKLFLLSGMLVVLMAMAGLLCATVFYFLKHGKKPVNKTAAERQASETQE